MNTPRAKPSIRRHICSRLATLAAGVELAVAGITQTQSTFATDYTWDGGGGDDAWGTGANWVGDSVPSPGSTNNLIFSGTTRLTPQDDYGDGDDFQDINFDSTAGAFTIGNTGANGIDWFGSINNNSSETQTIGFRLHQSASNTINANTGDITLNSSALIFRNSQALTLSASSGRTIQIDSDIDDGGGAGSAISVTGGGIVNLRGANTFTSGIIIKSGGLVGGVNADQSISSLFGTGAIQIGDSATGADARLWLTSYPTYANAITVDSGSGARILSTNSVLAGQSPTVSGTITLNNNLTLAAESGGTLRVTGVINDGASSFGLTVDSAGTGDVRLNAANTFDGGVTIKRGSVEMQSSGSALGTGTVTIGDTTGSNNATLRTSVGLTATNAITVAAGTTGTNTIRNDSTGTTTFSGAVALNNNLTLKANNTGALTLSNVITGGTTASITNAGAGTNTVTLSGTIGNGTGTVSVVQNSATSLLFLNAANTYTGATTIATGTLRVGNANALGATGYTTNLGSTGSATTATLTAVNTNTTLASGTVNVTSGGAAANRVITANGYTSNLFSLANVNTVLASDLTFNVTNSTVNGDAMRVGNITGTGNVVYNLNGNTNGSNATNINLFTATTFTGGITITGNTSGNLGEVKMGNTSALKAANSVTLDTGGRFNINNLSPTIAGLNSASAGLGTVFNSSSNSRTLTIGGTTATNYDYSGLLTATTLANLKLAIALTGSGSQTLSGSTNDYAGGTDINNGTLILGNKSALGTGVITFNSTTAGSTPVLQANTDLSGINKLANALTVANTQGSATIGGSNNLEISGSTILASGASRTLTINNSATTTFSGNTFITNTDAARTATINGSGNATISGVIDDNVPLTNTNAAGLTYSGSGTLTLSNAANTYAGVTTVSGGGKLSVGTLANGGSASSIGNSSNAASSLVLNNGTLSYTGTSVSIDRGFTYSSVNGGTIEVTNAATNLEFTGIAAQSAVGASSLTKTGAGTLTLSGTADNSSFGLIVNAGEADLNNSAGRVITRNGVTINGGLVKLTGASSDLIQNSQVVTLTSGTFDMNGKSETIGAVGGSGGVIENLLTSSTSTLTVGSGDISGSYSGVLQNGAGVLALTKTGTGTQTLSGANTYTGATNVTNGTLQFAQPDASVVALSGGLSIATSGTAVLTAHGGDASQVKVLDITGLTINGTTAFVGGGFKAGDEIVDSPSFGGLASPAPVPEPGTVGLLAVGAIGGLLLCRRSRKSGSQ